MLFYIDDTRTVSEVQEAFINRFPGLKIEFYKKRDGTKNALANGHLPIGALRNLRSTGMLEILSWYTVARLEKECRERFGLQVQVFRKERGAWVPISHTDHCTLRQHSEMAQQALSASLKIKTPFRAYEYL
jgi:hypothetical protein